MNGSREKNLLFAPFHWEYLYSHIVSCLPFYTTSSLQNITDKFGNRILTSQESKALSNDVSDLKLFGKEELGFNRLHQ